jgi:hypothetical protein
VHRHKGGVHPGRKKLAKRSGASLRAVNYTLALLRDFKVIEATAHATGNSAGYRVGEIGEFSAAQVGQGGGTFAPLGQHGGTVGGCCGG